MSLFIRQILAWVILFAIIWDTILTAYLLLVFLQLKRELKAIQEGGKSGDSLRLD